MMMMVNVYVLHSKEVRFPVLSFYRKTLQREVWRRVVLRILS